MGKWRMSTEIKDSFKTLLELAEELFDEIEDSTEIDSDDVRAELQELVESIGDLVKEALTYIPLA
jgi:NTP pyrophosphatase (non-canonical NTP hydrolase)